METLSPYPWDLPLSSQNAQACGAVSAAPHHSGRWVGAPVASLRSRILRPGEESLSRVRRECPTSPRPPFCTYYGSESLTFQRNSGHPHWGEDVRNSVVSIVLCKRGFHFIGRF